MPHQNQNQRANGLWLGWAYLTKKMPHAATTPIVTAFKCNIKICMSHRKKWALGSPAGEI
jgi:hypothetical protein